MLIVTPNSLRACLLGLGLLNPGFAVAGLLLAIVPIVIHLLNRRRFKTVSWAAMEFLLRAMRKNRRRLRFEQWLLLAVRCFVVLLLGLALARPLGCRNDALAGLGRRASMDVFVIDNSYSMAYEVNRSAARTHLDQAKRIAKAILSGADSGGTSAAVIAAARPARAVVSQPTYDLQSVSSSIDRVGQSFSATDLGGALDAALKLARETPDQPNKNLYVLTDGTRSAFEGAQSAALRDLGPQLSSLFHVHLYNLAEGRAQSNAAVVDVAPASNLVTNKFASEFKATLRGVGASEAASLQWQLDDRAIEAATPVRTDGRVEVMQTHALFNNGGPHVLTVRLLNGDPLQLDNVFHRVIDVTSELKVLIVEGKRGATPLEGSGAFLRLALAPPTDAKGSTQSYVVPELISDLELGNKLLGDYSAVILAGVGQIGVAAADRLKSFVEQGGTLLLFMGDSVEKDNYNSVLLPRKLLPGAMVKLVSVGTDQRGALFDFKPSTTNRFLRVFANQEDSGLDSAQVFSYWQVDLSPAIEAEPILNYLRSATAGGRGAGSAEDPAITAHTLGQGRVVFVSTSANPDWTNLPAKLAYVPLIHELLTGSVRSGDYWMNLQVGQRLVIPSTLALSGAPSFTDPSGRPFALIAPDSSAAGGDLQTYHSEPLEKPGVYSLAVGNRRLPIAVNVPAGDEADVAALSDAAIRKALGDADIFMHGAEPPTRAASPTQAGDFGWWCMAVLLAALALECFLAMRFGHYRRAESGAVVTG